jgi:hypothetical protein
MTGALRAAQAALDAALAELRAAFSQIDGRDASGFR